MAVSGTSSTSNSNNNASLYSATANSSLGKDDFLKLLMAQLSNQDPMSPMEDKDFMAQMAQFSSLEQIQNLNTTMTLLNDAQTRGIEVSQATSLIGKTVSIQVPTGETDSDGYPVYATVSGEVSKVKLVDGWPQLIVNDKAYELANVTEVSA